MVAVIAMGSSSGGSSGRGVAVKATAPDEWPATRPLVSKTAAAHQGPLQVGTPLIQ